MMIKKLLAILLISIFSHTSVMAVQSADILSVNPKISAEKIALYKNVPPIEDELLKAPSFSNVAPIYMRDNTPIRDELMETIEPDKHTIKLFVRKNIEAKEDIIEDELITSDFKAKFGAVSVLKVKKKTIIEDNFIKNNFVKKDKMCVKPKTVYDFSKPQIPVQLKIIKNISTKNKILEGDSILFKTVKDIKVNGINLPKGTNIIGRVETVSASDKMGTPANIVLDNFHVQNHPEISFYGSVSKTGANRSLWVYPLYQAGNIMLYVAGFAFVPIHGGAAKLLTKETYTVYYEVQ